MHCIVPVLLLLVAASIVQKAYGQFQNSGASARLTFTGTGLQGWLADPTVPAIVMGGATVLYS